MLTSREIEYYYQTLLPGAASHEWVINEDILLSMNNSELALPRTLFFSVSRQMESPFGYRCQRISLCFMGPRNAGSGDAEQVFRISGTGYRQISPHV